MSTTVTGLILGIEYATPIVLWGLVYRLGRRMDLSLDANIALGAVAFATVLKNTGSPTAAVAAGAAAAVVAALILAGLVEWARVPVEIGSLMWGYAVFRACEYQIGESVSLVEVGHRIHANLNADEVVPSLVLLVAVIVTVQFLLRSHLGLMFKGLGDNPSLPVRWPAWVTRSVVAVGVAGLLGVAGAIQVDREGTFSTAFSLARVVDGFVVAELTAAVFGRFQRLAESGPEASRPILARLAAAPITLQLVLGAIALTMLTYVLIRFLPPSVPSIAEALIVLAFLSRPARHRLAGRRAEPSGVEGLTIDRVFKSFGSGLSGRVVLDGVTMSLASNRGLWVLYGPVASGKTTLLHILSGRVQPDSGHALFNGESVASQSRLLTQNPVHSVALSLTVRENIALALGRRRGTKSPRALPSTAEATQILGRVSESDALLQAMDRPAATLSGGQQQLLACAMVFADESKVVLADEPTKMLDPRHRSLVESQLRALSETRMVLMTSHEPRLDLAPTEHHLHLSVGRLEDTAPREKDL